MISLLLCIVVSVVTFSDGHLIDILPLLVLSELGGVPVFHHQDVLTVLLTGPTFTLNVASEGLREVELDDQVTRWNIDSLLDDAGGDEDIDLSTSKLFQFLIHYFLL